MIFSDIVLLLHVKSLKFALKKLKTRELWDAKIVNSGLITTRSPSL